MIYNIKSTLSSKYILSVIDVQLLFTASGIMFWIIRFWFALWIFLTTILTYLVCMTSLSCAWLIFVKHMYYVSLLIFHIQTSVHVSWYESECRRSSIIYGLLFVTRRFVRRGQVIKISGLKKKKKRTIRSLAKIKN